MMSRSIKATLPTYLPIRRVLYSYTLLLSAVVYAPVNESDPTRVCSAVQSEICVLNVSTT